MELNVKMLNYKMLNVITVIVLSVIMLIVIIVSVVVPSVILLNVVAPQGGIESLKKTFLPRYWRHETTIIKLFSFQYSPK